MNERLPYEEQLKQQWDSLPLPDENLAWADMKRRLDEDEDRRLLPFWLRGCAGWGLLGILFLGFGWWVVRPEKWFRKKQGDEKVNTVSDIKITTKGKDSAFKLTDTTAIVALETNDSIRSAADSDENIDSTGTSGIKKEKNIKAKDNTEIISNKAGVTKREKQSSGPGNNKTIAKKAITKSRKSKSIPENNNNKDKPSLDSTTIIAQTVEKRVDSSALFTKTTGNTDSVRKPSGDSVVQKAKQDVAIQDKQPEKDSAVKNSLKFSAGLALHQQLPLGGQKFTPYNSLGRKGSLADYIPSVYMRLEKGKKWFLQAEFRYGAPQYTKEFTYRQSITPDTGSNPAFSTIRSSKLKKTFYHQLPLTFNYYIRPGWSVGAGMQWNKFFSAISEREVSRKNNFTQLDSIISKTIIKEDTNSVFRKSYWQAVVETQYQWKRFSVGAKYSFGLQPYIRFTLPGQGERQERNHSLQIFIRYELWKQKK